MVNIIQPPRIETKIRDDVMAVFFPKELLQMSDEDWHFFISLKEIKKLRRKNLSIDDLRTGLDRKFRHYFYMDGNPRDLIAKIAELPQDNFYDAWGEYANRNALELIDQKDFDPNKLMCFSSYDNFFYWIDSDMPISRPYFKDYIGGVANDHYDLNKAEKILRKHKWVSKVERIDIPWYNRDTHTEAVQFVVWLPQKEYEQAVRYYRDEKKEEFWSCRLKDCFTSPYSLKPFDFLGLLPALNKETRQKVEKNGLD